MDEFVALARAENKYTFNEASKMTNQTKNRYKNVYPYDSTRVQLSNPAGTLAGSDYINASHIDGYIQQCAFIATQAPLQPTFEDFWRMIWEQDCRSIVMLSKEQEAGKVCFLFIIGDWLLVVFDDHYTSLCKVLLLKTL